jgi:VCBS repeat protein
LATLFVLATLNAAAHRAAAGSGTTWPIFGARTASGFRLGTAGRPFAWSTAVGDLNADGRLDYVIADRIGRGASGFEYEVELSISGLASQSVTFDSRESALVVSLRDVDHDQDLDVVVSSELSPTVVRVWLNDGRGAFAEAASTATSPEWHAGPLLAGDADADRAMATESVSRRADDAAAAVRTCPIRLALRDLLRAGPSSGVHAPPAIRRDSRGPPCSAPLFT